MNFISAIKGFVQLVVLLAELSPQMVKLWRAWETRNNRTLSASERKRLSDSVREAVRTQDTSDLEAFLTRQSGKLE